MEFSKEISLINNYAIGSNAESEKELIANVNKDEWLTDSNELTTVRQKTNKKAYRCGI